MTELGAEKVGETINDRYHLERVLGSGATGTVYAAKQLAVDRTVAVKLLHESDDVDFQKRFETEARAIARLNHRNCITLHDFGFWEAQDTHYMVTEFIDGELLSDRMMDHMATEFVVHMAIELAGALNHAHQSNILHRDLKPENIMLVKGDHRWESVKVLDFGLARMLDSTGIRTTPMGGVRSANGPQDFVAHGTPIYMSPEQCRGDFTITTATDIYSMGVLLFELLEGHVPFDGDSRVQVCEKHQNAPIPEMAREGLPDGLRSLVAHMLAKDPRERPSARDVLDALRLLSTSEESPKAGWENEEFQFEEVDGSDAPAGNAHDEDVHAAQTPPNDAEKRPDADAAEETAGSVSAGVTAADVEAFFDLAPSDDARDAPATALAAPDSPGVETPDEPEAAEAPEAPAPLQNAEDFERAPVAGPGGKAKWAIAAVGVVIGLGIGLALLGDTDKTSEPATQATQSAAQTAAVPDVPAVEPATETAAQEVAQEVAQEIATPDVGHDTSEIALEFDDPTNVEAPPDDPVVGDQPPAVDSPPTVADKEVEEGTKTDATTEKDAKSTKASSKKSTKKTKLRELKLSL